MAVKNAQQAPAGRAKGALYQPLMTGRLFSA
jgi:hypothetical protein